MRRKTPSHTHDEIREMTEILTRRGYDSPSMWARKLAREGIGPYELRHRLASGEELTGSFPLRGPSARSRARRDHLRKPPGGFIEYRPVFKTPEGDWIADDRSFDHLEDAKRRADVMRRVGLASRVDERAFNAHSQLVQRKTVYTSRAGSRNPGKKASRDAGPWYTASGDRSQNPTRANAAAKLRARAKTERENGFFAQANLLETQARRIERQERQKAPRRASRDAGPYRFVRAENLRAGDRVMLSGARPLTLRTVIVTGRGGVRAIASDGTPIELDAGDRVRVSPGSGVLALRDAALSRKIRLLRREGYPANQAAAIAYSMRRRRVR